jgi:hypothetical protein
MDHSLAKTDVLFAARDEPVVARCAACRHRHDDRQAIEQRVAGLIVFGSAFGASIGTSRLCLLHDRLVSPDDGCARFSATEA